jgi:hypothetical protein
MTIHPIRFATLLILAGTALAPRAAFAEPAQSYKWNQAPAQLPDAPDNPARRAGNMAASGPMISAVQPQSGQAGDMVRIQGSGLAGVNHVLFSDSRDAYFKVLSDNEIQCTVPDGAVPGPIELGTPQGSVKTPVPFAVAPQ